MKFFAFACTLGLLYSGLLFAECRPNATAEQVETAKARVLADPDVKKTTTEENYLKVEIRKPDGTMVLFYFTLPGHPAHPANVVTTVYEADGKVWLYSKGFSAGDCHNFEQWLKGFEQQHERIRQNFTRNGA